MKEIKLTRGFVALVDDEDYEELNKVKWQAHQEGRTNYATRTIVIDGKKKAQKMHRVVLRMDSSLLVDHKDGNGLNNQKSNLRVVTKKQNQKNIKSHIDSSSRFLGVSFRPARNKFRARIFENGKEVFLGHYNSEVDAAIAYNEAAKRVHGEFANLNSI